MPNEMFGDMALTSNKENLAPATSSDPLQRKDSSPRKKGRSKSIGPGGIEEDDGKENKKDDAKNRRKSTFVPATRGIIPSQEDAERRAARRKSMANRRVSFAPEATLHTWDVIEYMRDHTTSTESSESTRRASGITRSSNPSSPAKSMHSDGEEPPSTPPEQADSPEKEAASPEHQRDLHQTKRRRGSVVPPAAFNNEDGVESSSMASGSSDVSGSEDEEGSDDMEDATATGTAMSLDTGDNTLLSNSESEGSSTSSSARLEQNLRQASELAGTRGIEFDEFGGDESMELAGDETTNAFKPWAQRDDEPPIGSASLDQENVNPFSPAFRAEIAPAQRSRPSTIQEEDEEDMSMEVTRAVGGVMQPQTQPHEQDSSPMEDGTMDFTQAVGKVNPSVQAPSPSTRSAQKRRRSTTDAGSPGAAAPCQNKRRRSSVARSSMGDETMDLTVAMGGIQENPPAKVDRRRSVAKRRSSGAVSEQDEATMDFTRPMGGIQASKRQSNDSFDENEELTMELTTVLGGIKAGGKPTTEERPTTPRESASPQRVAQEANTTPKDQERFREVPDSGPGKLLTPILQKQADMSAERASVGSKNSESPAKASPAAQKAESRKQRRSSISSSKVLNSSQKGSVRKSSALKNEIIYPELPAFDENVWANRAVPVPSPGCRSVKTPESEIKRQLDAQLQERAVSPTLEKQLRSTPTRAVTTPPKVLTPQGAETPQKPATPSDAGSKVASAKSSPKSSAKSATPKSATPKTATPKTVTPKDATPNSATSKAATPKSATPKARTPQAANSKPAGPTIATPQPATPQENLAVIEEAATPRPSSQHEESQDPRRLADNIKMMSTPRKETLKAMTPMKQTPGKQVSPVKRHTPRAKSAHKTRSTTTGSPARQLSDDLVRVQSSGESPKPIRLQEFLDAANIRFMDLTTTKRRMTTMPTPSKNRKSTSSGEEPEITLGSAVVAAACTEPEKELFSHACHELKRYIHEGKGAIKELEAETFRETPPLLRAYMAAPPDRKLAIDAQLRDMKTHARLRSKEMWYGWRGQLLDELMHVLQGIAEGLLKDDETLQSQEEILGQHLPGMLEQRDALQREADELQQTANRHSEEEKEELDSARERIVVVDEEMEAKRRMIRELQQDAQEQDTIQENLEESKTEFTATIQEAERVRESCRTISLDEINALKDSVKNLEDIYNWSITTASSTPASITMAYKSSIQLYFHPSAFLNSPEPVSRPNAPIGLTYIGPLQPLPTSLRFFLQLLRASLQALPQCATKVSSLLNLVSSGWDTAASVAESERRLAIEGLTDTRIVSDERLSIAASVLVPAMKTKVRVAFDVLAAVGEDLALCESVEVGAKVVYGEQCNEQKMQEFVEGSVGGSVEGWESAVVELREKLVKKGLKGTKR